MKIVRRLTIQIERRTLTLSVGSVAHPLEASAVSRGERSSPTCPHCKCLCLQLQQAVRIDGGDPVPDLAALLSSHLHVQLDANGVLWACQRSIEQFTTQNSDQNA